jgi:heme oxygenase
VVTAGCGVGDLPERLREATRALHTEVERSPLMHELLRGVLPRPAYCAMLRSLHVIYVALEQGLQRQAAHPQLVVLPVAPLARAAALARDLDVLHGPGWPQALHPAPEALAYARHLQALTDTAPGLLAAHAYVRYLGDLNGGQALARVVRRALALAPDEGVDFYDFGDGRTVAAAIAALRDGLARCAPDEAAVQAIVDEAVDGFRRHRRLFDELATAG